MKKAFFVACLIGAATSTANAQSTGSVNEGIITIPEPTSAPSPTATLNHEGQISTFYGGQALTSAYDKAVNGDIITLSAGKFSNSNNFAITKAITIRGVGNGINIDGTTNQSTLATVLEGPVIRLSSGQLYIEGIRFDDRPSVYPNSDNNGPGNVQFVKCHFTSGFQGYSDSTSIYMINCAVDSNNLHKDLEISDYTPFSAISSYFKSVHIRGNSTANAPKSFTNCVMGVYYDLYDATVSNSIVFAEKNWVTISKATISYSLIDMSKFYGYASAEQFHDYSVTSDEGWFKEGTFYQLTDQAKALYKGADGTEVGIYGGATPFTTTPSYARITKFNVAPKTTDDGKLSVDITVEQPQ